MAIATEELELSEAAEKLMPALETLPAQDQRRIAHRLLAVLDGPAEEPAEVKTAWKAELRRRVEEIDSGKITPVPIEEMFRKSREKHP